MSVKRRDEVRARPCGGFDSLEEAADQQLQLSVFPCGNPKFALTGFDV